MTFLDPRPVAVKDPKPEPEAKPLPELKPRIHPTPQVKTKDVTGPCPSCDGIKQADGKTHRFIFDVANQRHDYGVCLDCAGSGEVTYTVADPVVAASTSEEPAPQKE